MNHSEILTENRKDRNHFGDLSKDEGIILNNGIIDVNLLDYAGSGQGLVVGKFYKM